jgi:phosphate transport system substrate-binding protein
MKNLKSLLQIISSLAIYILFFNFNSNAQNIELLGAGATFPYPLYSKMFDVYYNEQKIKINYQSIGSGGGIRQLLNKTVDFGASDAFMSDEELKKESAQILHIPICLGAVSVTYNLTGNPELKFTPEIIADIFLGKIKNWNDAKIKEINSGAKLPNLNITVVHRSDGSGTTFIFIDYVTKISNEWKEKVGAGTSVNWPVGLGGKGNPGVAGLIKQIPGSIGYVELIYALQNNMPVSLIKNKSGVFVKPTLESTSTSANIKLPDDTRVSLTDTDASNGYPISGFTWILVFKEQNYDSRPREKAKTIVDLLWWMTHEGQIYAEPLHYSPLSKESVKKAESIIKSINYNGKSLIK